MMRGCSVREMAARGAWGLPRMEMRDLECVQRGEMEERVRTESLKKRDGGRWRWAQKKREDRGRGRPGREMDVREIGSVRWVLKGRDGAWRRWVVRDEEEMMMGCCFREMELWSLGSASRSGRKMKLGGDGL
ncbi:hypothetical protein MRB53_028610 [Persea americana]|uniref:Uncharacterized protein n=1 Tax=Persea americana TaxID=3435 RepID=A0ACC2KG25_PERAE|nr:hypothetical protein MRB53_028610 [Persea americana]